MYQKLYKIKILSYEIEQKLWKEFSYEERIKILIETHAKLVFKIAKIYRNLEISFDDLAQEGIIGIIRAAEKYEPQPNKRFCVYAKLWIQGLMQNFILKNWSIVKNASLGQKKIIFREYQLNQNKIESFCLKKDFSLNMTMNDSVDEYIDLLPEEEDLFEDQYIKANHENHLNDILFEVMNVLTPLEKKIILSKFFDKQMYMKKLTLIDMNRIENMAIRKMYMYFKDHVDLLRKISS